MEKLESVNNAADLETYVRRSDHLVWEDEGIAEADADIQAGRLVGSAEVKAWIDSMGSDHELPVPYSER